MKGRIDSSLFLCYNIIKYTIIMDTDKVKFLIQSIEVLIDELKAEVYSKDETFRVSETQYEEEGEIPMTTSNLYPEVTDDL